jgi:hypothetical protein
VLRVWLESVLGHTAMAGSSGGGDEKGGRGENGAAAHMRVAKRRPDEGSGLRREGRER